MDGRPNLRNKAAFSNSSSVVSEDCAKDQTLEHFKNVECCSDAF